MHLKYYLPALIWASIILILTLMPGNYIPEPPFQLLSIDKVVHLLIFGIQSFLSLAGFYRSTGERSPHLLNILIIVITCCLYGAAIEFIQEYVPGRSRSAGDMIANTAGAITGYIAYRIYFRNREKA
jgi:VanZ family protein